MEWDNKKKSVLTIICMIAVVLIIFWAFQVITRMLAVNQGVDYLSDKEYEKAYSSFVKAENKHTVFLSKKNIRYYEGECLIYLGRYEEAVEVYERILDNKKEARAYALEGFAYQQNSNPKKAVKAYKKAIEADEDAGIGYYYLYGYYVENEQYEEALAILEQAEEVPVTSMEQEIAFAKIVAYEKLLDYDQALKEAEEYVEAYPEDETGKAEKEFLETR